MGKGGTSWFINRRLVGSNWIDQGLEKVRLQDHEVLVIGKQGNGKTW